MTANEPVVYRIFDKADRLIYIGCTKNLEQRLNCHRSAAWWYSLMRRVDVDYFESMPDAFAAEVAAIRSERPAFNLQHTGRSWNYPLRLTAEEAETCRAWVSVKSSRIGYLPLSLRWVTAPYRDIVRAANVAA